MKLICLPNAISKIIKTLSYISVFILDIIHFLLTPITWVQLKAHLAIILFTGTGYVYLRFFVQNNNAIWIALIGMLAVIIAVLLLKLFRTMLHHIRQRLIKIVYCPLDYCIYVRPNILNKRLFCAE